MQPEEMSALVYRFHEIPEGERRRIALSLAPHDFEMLITKMRAHAENYLAEADRLEEARQDERVAEIEIARRRRARFKAVDGQDD